MKTKIVISSYEMSFIDTYIKWCFENPSPCDSCESNKASCTGCKLLDIYKDRKETQYEKTPADYHKTYEFLDSIGYIDKTLQKMEIDKEIKQLQCKQTNLCGELNRLFLKNDIEIKGVGK